MLDKIKALQEEIKQLTARSADEAEHLRIKYLSKKGIISELFNDFKTIPNEQKREVGKVINVLKNEAQEFINGLKEQFAHTQVKGVDIDLTLPGTTMKLGSRHPLSIVRNEIVDIFARLGFNVAAQVRTESNPKPASLAPSEDGVRTGCESNKLNGPKVNCCLSKT